MSKENLSITFAEELEDEIETQGIISQASKSDHQESSAKDQIESKSKAISSGSASNLEGCLEFPAGLSTSSGFDDNLIIYFNPPMLQSLKAQTLEFLDKRKTPQSHLV